MNWSGEMFAEWFMSEGRNPARGMILRLRFCRRPEATPRDADFYRGIREAC